MNPGTVFFLLANIQLEYDDHAFGLKPNESSFVLVYDSGIFPTRQDNYVVHNIGRSSVHAALWYGDEVQWFGVVAGATVNPGETKTLDNGDKRYYYTGLKITNSENVRAIVHGEGGYLPSPFNPDLKFYLYKYLQKILTFSVKYFVHNKLVIVVFKELTHLFWPEHKPDIWSEILGKITPMLEDTTRKIIVGLLQNDISVFKEQIGNLVINDVTHREQYMNIAYSLVGLEKKFNVTNIIGNFDTVSFYILPLFSNVMSMKINFYILGIQYKDQLGLTDNDINEIKAFANRAYNNSFEYVKYLSKNSVDYLYNNSKAEGIFNTMMISRSHMALHGEEYLPIWEHKIKNPFSTDEVYNPVISYSSFFGKPTGNLYAQATSAEVPQPLRPKMINGTRNALKKVLLYMWCSDPLYLKIGGARLYFQNGDEHMLGTETEILRSFDLGDAKIMQMTAFGDGKIDGLKFYLSDGRIHAFGQVNDDRPHEDFKLADHYISSFYLSSDSPDLSGQAANIAVSFQWFVKNAVFAGI